MGVLVVVAALLGAAFVTAVWRRRGGPPRAGLPALAALAALALLAASVRVVPAGHVGVVDLFGRVSPRALGPGVRLVNPLARVERMSTRTQEVKEAMDVPSREGLSMQVEASVLFHLDPESAPAVYQTVGGGYQDVLLHPRFRSVARTVTAAYAAEALYTSSREEVARRIADELRTTLGPRGITIEATPLRRLVLPSRLAAAIEEKLGAEQESLRMEFVLARERREAERKRIEAQGVADFQRVVSEGISPQLLRWKGIEATLKVAESQNAKVVVIGAGKDGLPVILGGQ
jgi:regulator of protease activity HflC (stomatin/prohibitin superfamily)